MTPLKVTYLGAPSSDYFMVTKDFTFKNFNGIKITWFCNDNIWYARTINSGNWFAKLDQLCNDIPKDNYEDIRRQYIQQFVPINPEDYV